MRTEESREEEGARGHRRRGRKRKDAIFNQEYNPQVKHERAKFLPRLKGRGLFQVKKGRRQLP